jgi:hypothetical protein
MADRVKYNDYFDIDEKYFPQITEASITDDPQCWKRTYPHVTFIDMLRGLERCMARLEKRSLWIQGAYGVGKSQCAYTLKKLLDVSEEELREYWNSYKPLEKHTGLLESLIGHRNSGIVTAYRYATGDIETPRHFYNAIQESVREALRAKGLYEGENTLKECVIAWIEKPANKNYLNELLSQIKYSSKFAQSTADDILLTLRKDGNTKQIMSNLFFLASEEDINVLTFDVDKLITWITDVIDRNNIKIVFVWDQFGDYFEKTGGDKEDTFQKLCELVNHKPFFLVPVTHEGGQTYIKDNNSWKAVRDRFDERIIDLPPNIAFYLIGHALKKNMAALSDWIPLADDLNGRVSSSRSAVLKEIEAKDPQVIKDIMPLHPMTALLLKNIATAFKSNQRSMFDFIKSSDTQDLKAFQWFVKETGPSDDHPLLTVDMLWSFFYERGKDNLTSDIRLVLDTYPQQQNLREDEKAVLKAILIMQAIDQRSGGTIELLKATDQNIGYVFEGIYSGLDVKCKNLAKGLVEKGILVLNPIGNGRHVYAAAVLAGDQAKIDGYKKEIRSNSKTAKLVADGGLATVLQLSPALRLRYETETGTSKINTVTTEDFKRTIDGLREKPVNWRFHAVIAFAKDEFEAAVFRKDIKAAASNEQYKNIVFIDALSTPLGLEAFEQYVDYAAMSMYYQGNNNKAAIENNDNAKRILDRDWKNKIYNGQFIIYNYENSNGEKVTGGNDVAFVLQTIVTNRFPHVFDFIKGLSESVLKITPAMRQSAKSGIAQTTSRHGDRTIGGVVVGIETKVFSKDVWGVEKYWESSPLLSISKIKIEIDKLIETAFCRDGEGQISIGELYDFLEEKYGFAPCNLSAFLAGFLLKEYSGESYRYSDSLGDDHETMSQDKLAEMLGNYIGKTVKPTYIVKMTAKEMAFYDLTEKAWQFPKNSYSSVCRFVNAIIAKMREFGFPVWCLSKIDTHGIFDVVQMYIELVQLEGREAHSKAMKIGEVAIVKTTLATHLKALLTVENCQNGMREFLVDFEGGKIQILADEIGAGNSILTDIRNIFKVEYSCLWDRATGEEEVRKLLIDYGIVKETNAILNSNTHSKAEAFKEWRERLKFIGISCETLKAKYPAFARVFDTLLKICKQEDMQPKLKEFYAELITHGAEIREFINNTNRSFALVYEPYLEGLSESDIANIKSKMGTGLFELSKTDCNVKVKEEADKFRKNQLRTQMLTLWSEKTGTKTPLDWSSRYRLPILSCVKASEFTEAKKAFDTLNSKWSPEADIKGAIEFLTSTDLFDTIADESKRDAAFVCDIIREYRSLLPNINKVREALERITVDTYDWHGNPNIEARIKQLAEAEYNAGGSDKAISRIDEMSDSELKNYLKRLVRETKNIKVGIAIIEDGGEQ